MYNTNNYGYNPYGRYIPQQPIQQMPTINENLTIQPVNNTYKLNGKIVDSIDVVKAIEYPLDGSTSYYPLADNSCIVTKQLQNDGTTKMTVYKPITEEQKDVPKYATMEDIKNSIEELDLSEIDDIKEDLKDIKKELKDLKKKKKDD